MNRRNFLKFLPVGALVAKSVELPANVPVVPKQIPGSFGETRGIAYSP